MFTSANTKLNQGFLLVTVLVFGSVLFVIISSFVGYVVTQNHLINQRVQIQKATDIAEAGLNYYKWFLTHYPEDPTNGTGVPGPYVHTYYDPEGSAIGEFSLDVDDSVFCGDVASMEITSTGYTYQDPTVKKTISARYSRPTVAEYSYIINSNVWAGADRTIIGPYHSNQGIRMDGTNQSVVTSGKDEWLCQSRYGCTPDATKDGVFTTTANANPALFVFPSTPIDFAGLLIDLAKMKDRAENAGGIYLPPSGGAGYRVVFNANDTVTVSRVTPVAPYYGYYNSWKTEQNVIASVSNTVTYNISPSCPLIFVQDKVWLEGVVNKKVAIAAADLSSAANSPSIILNGNITYTSATTSGLLAIAENEVLFGLVVPNNMVLNGIFIAQQGRVGRNHYVSSGTYKLPDSLTSYVFRNSLSINGTVMSEGSVGSQWVNAGVPVSGFYNRYNSYDRNLVLNPPPLIPKTSDVFRMSDWKSVE